MQEEVCRGNHHESCHNQVVEHAFQPAFTDAPSRELRMIVN